MPDYFTREDETRFTMRIDSKVLDEIRGLAAKNKRSVAKEIEFILEDWLRKNTDLFSK